MRHVYLNVLLVEIQVIPFVMDNGLLHLIPVTNILSGLSVIGRPTLSVELFVTQIFLNMNVVKILTVASVMEDIVPFTSSVSILDLANVPRTRIATCMMQFALILLPTTLTSVPTVLKKELVLEDAEVWRIVMTIALMDIFVMTSSINVR